MERVTIAALSFASASIIVSLMSNRDAELPVRHALTLVLPLAVIAFPEAMDTGFRNTFRGRAHGGEGPTPVLIMRFVAFGLLIVPVVIHHAMGYVRIPA